MFFRWILAVGEGEILYLVVTGPADQWLKQHKNLPLQPKSIEKTYLDLFLRKILILGY